jgi:Family of unknown function (DUF5647)
MLVMGENIANHDKERSVSLRLGGLVSLPRTIFKRRVAMRAADRKLVERNLDLIFEFEKYVLEHPEITEKIPRDAVVFMKVAGDQKFNRWSERQAKKQAKPGAPVVSITVKKMGPVHSRIEGLALEYAAA